MTNPMVLVTPNEDGNPLNFLTATQVDDLMADPYGSYGVRKFEDQEFLLKNPDPNYWPDGTGVLLRVQLIMPVPVTVQWRLP